MEFYENSYSPYSFKDIDAGNIPRKCFYNIILNNEVIPINNYFCENLLLDRHNPIIWASFFECTSEVKLIQLQWKILHNIYPTGTLRFKMGKEPNEVCKFCDERDTLIHFFFNCHVAKLVWKEAEKVIFKLTDKAVSLTETIVMTGLFPDEVILDNKSVETINHICLIGKHTISKYKREAYEKINILFERDLWIRNIHV